MPPERAIRSENAEATDGSDSDVDISLAVKESTISVENSLNSFSFATVSRRKSIDARKTVLERSLSFVKTKLGLLHVEQDDLTPATTSSHTPLPALGSHIPTPDRAMVSKRSNAVAFNGPVIATSFPTTSDNSGHEVIRPPSPVQFRRGSFTKIDTRNLANKSTELDGVVSRTKSLPRRAESFTVINPVQTQDSTESAFSPKYAVLPNNHAAFTTDTKLNIMTVNDKALSLLGYSQAQLLGTNILQLMPYQQRNKMKRIFDNRFHDGTSVRADHVLFCGRIIRMLRNDGQAVSVSLWLKFKSEEHTQYQFYLWIVEEVHEEVAVFNVDDESGKIVSISPEFTRLFGYHDGEHITIMDIIPSLLSLQPFSLQQVLHLRFFAGRTKSGSRFPLVIKHSSDTDPQFSTLLHVSTIGSNHHYTTLYASSISNLSGVVYIRENGIITACNPIFMKYLFGFSSKYLPLDFNVQELLPQVFAIIDNLPSADAASIIPPATFSYVDNSTPSPLTSSAAGAPPTPASPKGLEVGQTVVVPIEIDAIHRDGSTLKVQLQVKKLVKEGGVGYGLWISFCRKHDHVPEAEHTTHYDTTEPLKHDIINKPLAKVKDVESSTSTLTMPDAAASPASVDPSSPIPTDVKRSFRGKGIEEYELLDSLGEGAYGFVNLAVKKSDPEKRKVVLKHIYKSRILVDGWKRDTEYGLVPIEIHTMVQLARHPHKNVVRLIEFFEDEDYFYVVMELFGFGMDLFDYIELHRDMGEPEMKRIFKQVLEAVNHLHEHNIVHRDIKDENIILDEDLNAQLIDFGSAAYVRPNRKFQTFCGTLDYASPEVLSGKHYTGPPQDVWALGILLYTLVYKENPFYNVDEIIEAKIRAPYVFSEGALDLIRFMLNPNVDERPTVAECLKHSWFMIDNT